MTDRPIPFTTPMIRALLDGRKTQTRRVLKSTYDPGGVIPDGAGGQMDYVEPSETPERPKYAVGDRLWVREAWRTFVSLDAVKPSELLNGKRGAGIIYLADGHSLSVSRNGERHEGGERDDQQAFGKYRPPMFMPRWASRLTLIVTDVRVQRLHDINRGDAMEEGCPFANMADGPNPRDWFSDLWDSIADNPKRPGCAWRDNPWVVALTFRTIHQNIDQIEKEAA